MGPYKKYTFYALFLLSAMVLGYNLYKLQMRSDEYFQLSLQNTSDKITLYPSRGNIYDRNGKLMAFNAAVHNLGVAPKSVPDSFSKVSLCSILEIDTNRFNELFKKAKKAASRKGRDNSFTGTATLISALSPRILAKLQEEIFDYPGFYLEIKSDRRYKTMSSAHVLGYINEVSQKTIQNDAYYTPGDIAGANGMELSYEQHLRGKKGVRNVLVNNFSIAKGAFEEGKYDTLAVAGMDLYSSLDLNLQVLGEQLLKGKRGSIVAIEPKTGEVLALVNTPTYDPSLLTGLERGKNFRALLMDKDKPFFNRAILGKYPPGSTFKTIMAAIGLQEGVCTPETRYACRGGYVLGSLRVGCHAHASGLNLHQSIQQSCNAWYCSVFRAIVDNPKYASTSEGYSNWRDHLSTMGIGVKLGIDLPNESPGFIPKAEYFDKKYNGRWKSPTIISLAIGQGEVSLTPLQMANMCAVIANKGYYFTPHVVKKIEGNNGANLVKTEKKYSRVQANYFDEVIRGMEMVYESGTARGSKIKGLNLCGKTGTAQNPHGEDHSLFIAFGPKEDPKIAVAVIVENGGFGSTYGAPIASLMMEKYLLPDSTTSRPDLMRRMLETELVKQDE